VPIHGSSPRNARSRAAASGTRFAPPSDERSRKEEVGLALGQRRYALDIDPPPRRGTGARAPRRDVALRMVQPRSPRHRADGVAARDDGHLRGVPRRTPHGRLQ
jgi:hypothetical protein